VNFADWKDVRNILQVYEAVLVHLEEGVRNPVGWVHADAPKRELASLTKWLERDGLHYEAGRIRRAGQVVSLPTVHEVVAAFDVPELQRQLERLRTAVDDDPGLAIGTAKELIETSCKTILQARAVPFAEGADVGELVKAVRKELRLLPEDVPEAAKGAEAMRRLLSNLGAVAEGVTELRNLYGTGHGKTGKAKGPRHARLVSAARRRLRPSCSRRTRSERRRRAPQRLAGREHEAMPRAMQARPGGGEDGWRSDSRNASRSRVAHDSGTKNAMTSQTLTIAQLLSLWEPHRGLTEPPATCIRLWEADGCCVYIDSAWGPAVPYGPGHPTVKPEQQQLLMAALEGQDARLEEVAGDVVVEGPLRGAHRVLKEPGFSADKRPLEKVLGLSAQGPLQDHADPTPQFLLLTRQPRGKPDVGDVPSAVEIRRRLR
jgi:hypothetical protein